MENLIRSWLHPIDPIYRREVTHAKSNRRRKRSYVILALTFAFIMLCSLCFGGSSLLLTLPFVRLLVVVSTSGSIAHEVQSRTWDSLRTTLYSTKDIVKTKYAGALVRARKLAYYLVGTRIIVLLFYFLNYYEFISLSTSRFLVAFVYLTIDAVLDFITDGALGIVASTFASTPSRARIWAFTLGVASLFAQYALSAIILLSSSSETTCCMALLAIIILRYVIVLWLLKLAAWRAKRIGA